MDSARNREFSDLLATIAFEGIRVFADIDKEDILAYQTAYLANGFVLLKRILSQEIMAHLNNIIVFSKTQENNPRQFYRNHSDEASTVHTGKLSHALLPLYQIITQNTLCPTYSFGMNYIKGSHMLPHYDNYNNPVSSTLCYKNTGKPNPILIDRAKFNNPYQWRVTIRDYLSIPERNIERLDIDCGNIAIFRGREYLHWRNPVTEEADYRALLLHYSDYNYKGKVITNDQSYSDGIKGIAREPLDLDDYDSFREQYAMYFAPNSIY